MKTPVESPPLVLPAALAAEVEAAAAEEHRPAGDVLHDAVKRYMREKRWQKIRVYGEARAKELGLTEDDIPRLIAEVRAQQHQGHE